MSVAYCNYLDQHIANVGREMRWFIENRPDILRDLWLPISYRGELPMHSDHLDN